jgi:hypothetical protein
VLADLADWIERHLPGEINYQPLALCAAKMPPKST